LRHCFDGYPLGINQVMFGIIAVILFGLGAIISGAGISVSPVFSWHTLLLAGLICLTLHLLGAGAGYSPWRRPA
jgi:hypothetical protein